MRENVVLSELSSYKIGGPARFFCAPENKDEVRQAIEVAKSKNLAVFILGGGTNLLIDDAGFEGLVLRPDIKFLKKGGEHVTAGAGISITELLGYSIANSLSGLEWAGGLPGTFGGAVRGNAGCFGGEIKDVIGSVRSFDTNAMKIVERTADKCEFSYRDSIFKKKNGSEIILSATLRLKKGDAKEIQRAIEEKVAHRQKNHPLEYPNIGSIFKNIPLSKIHEESDTRYKKALEEGKLEFKGSQFSVKRDPFPVISTAKLISEAGLRGVSFGGAMISSKHPNFIVNALNAGSVDVKNLISLAKTEVKKKFGLQLEEEVQIL